MLNSLDGLVENEMTDTDVNENKTMANNQQLVQQNKGFMLSKKEFLEITGVAVTIAGLSAAATQVPSKLETVEAQAQPTTAPTRQVIPHVRKVCQSYDGILVRVVNERPTYIEGDPEDPKLARKHVREGPSGRLATLQSVYAASGKYAS